jgi:steroid delta-isomerase-like uncharacterized protein
MRNTRVLFTMLMFTALAMPACQKTDPAAAAAAKNREAMQAIIAALDAKNLSALDTYIDANYTEHTPDPWMKTKGLAGFKESMTANYAMFPDSKIKMNFVLADGDKVMAHCTWSGTNSGSIEGYPATGKVVSAEMVEIYKMTDGKCVERWGYVDAFKYMEQMGLMMVPASTMQGAPSTK